MYSAVHLYVQSRWNYMFIVFCHLTDGVKNNNKGMVIIYFYLFFF